MRLALFLFNIFIKCNSYDNKAWKELCIGLCEGDLHEYYDNVI